MDCPAIINSAVCVLLFEMWAVGDPGPDLASCSAYFIPLDGAENHNICPLD